ncbi:DedA family protein [Legionella adelaidensis]|nr:DedA family protein [Legionella adelaidensis]
MFAEYLQPLTLWIQANPKWALLFTFLVSLSESLAIIGSIIPGSVTMTAIGILAGSGIMRIDMTIIAAILGAIAGDSASYTLGYVFRNRLVNIWPFSKYPNWLKLGKDYFAKHGGKSVLIGRFIGPLRSIIPVIAGMMHMNRWHFLFANVISAIGWAILYVLPGILIGVASSELSPESASRLFMIVIILLIIIWVLGIAIKWIFK